MTHKRLEAFTLFAVLGAVLLSAGCAKKAAKVTPPAPPAPQAAPTATLAANPAVIQQGQWATLTWQTENANQVTIAGLGTVSASGSRTIQPTTSTTYTLVAQGPGGSKNASARVTVNQNVAATSSASDEDLFLKNMKDIFFDYDKANVRTDEAPVALRNAAFLTQHPGINVLIEGHCDDRGSEEYNLALGSNRAESVRQALLQQGVPAARIKTISYGKEKPFCSQDNEQCWQQNRVGHFAFHR